MNDLVKSLNKLNVLRRQACQSDLDEIQKAAIFSAAYILIQSLTQEFEERKIRGFGYLSEKLSFVLWNFKLMLDFEDGNGHSTQAHNVWALGHLQVVTRNVSKLALL